MIVLVLIVSSVFAVSSRPADVVRDSAESQRYFVRMQSWGSFLAPPLIPEAPIEDSPDVIDHLWRHFDRMEPWSVFLHREAQSLAPIFLVRPVHQVMSIDQTSPLRHLLDFHEIRRHDVEESARSVLVGQEEFVVLVGVFEPGAIGAKLFLLLRIVPEVAPADLYLVLDHEARLGDREHIAFPPVNRGVAWAHEVMPAHAKVFP